MKCLIQKQFSMFRSLHPAPLAFCPVSIKATFLLSSGFFLPLWCSFSSLNGYLVHSFPWYFFSGWFLKVDSATLHKLFHLPYRIPYFQADIQIMRTRQKGTASVDRNPAHWLWNLTRVNHLTPFYFLSWKWGEVYLPHPNSLEKPYYLYLNILLRTVCYRSIFQLMIKIVQTLINVFTLLMPIFVFEKSHK